MAKQISGSNCDVSSAVPFAARPRGRPRTRPGTPYQRRADYIRPKALVIRKAIARCSTTVVMVDYADLAEACECSRASVRGYIFALVKAGMIRRIGDPRNKRFSVSR